MLKGDEGFCNYLYQGQTLDAETGLAYNRFRYYSPEEGLYISQDPIGLEGGRALYGYVNDTNIWLDVFGLARAYNRNHKKSTTPQHGYEVYNKNGDVVKTGVSAGRIRKDGKSARAEKQVRRWNANPADPNGPYTSKVVKKLKRQTNAREKILKWEEKNADKHRATLDPTKHVRP